MREQEFEMSNFKYKTRGNSTPQGKPNVYFCCHINDFDRCFEEISNEILAKQNCAIWYTDKSVDHDEEFLFDLKQMQLFVMPITTNLLCSPNEALDVEFKFAIENHIPVLPLMQDKGLNELFNKKCGELQFLDKHNTDITGISYDEKLEKYLSSVLIGDELAEKIRDAFDAYVFLSYRKKDRKYAQELMQLIHKNDFCRDIAIWYDEFLTPGENFNVSIKDALQKSELFVLTVTPNLVNEINYIMTTEYPMARQGGKTILPAELVPTDRQKLYEQYEDIPAPTDAHNEAELSETLLESIKKIAVKENDASPEHNFLIGLAYLDGIDVETDCKRATSLIISAAESGLLDAMQKLVTMYEKGKGVAKDYRQALKWQRRVVDNLYRNFKEKATAESFSIYYREVEKYIFDLYDFDTSSPFVLGAIKIRMDCILLINNIEKEKSECFNDRKEYRKFLTNDSLMKVLLESKSRLQLLMGQYFSDYWCMTYRDWYMTYRDLLCGKEKQIDAIQQATICYWLSYSSGYAGDIDECLKYRKEAEEIVSKYSLENNHRIEELRAKCFDELPQLIKMFK